MQPGSPPVHTPGGFLPASPTAGMARRPPTKAAAAIAPRPNWPRNSRRDTFTAATSASRLILSSMSHLHRGLRRCEIEPDHRVALRIVGTLRPFRLCFGRSLHALHSSNSTHGAQRVRRGSCRPVGDLLGGKPHRPLFSFTSFVLYPVGDSALFDLCKCGCGKSQDVDGAVAVCQCHMPSVGRKGTGHRSGGKLPVVLPGAAGDIPDDHTTVEAVHAHSEQSPAVR